MGGGRSSSDKKAERQAQKNFESKAQKKLCKPSNRIDFTEDDMMETKPSTSSEETWIDFEKDWRHGDMDSTEEVERKRYGKMAFRAWECPVCHAWHTGGHVWAWKWVYTQWASVCEVCAPNFKKWESHCPCIFSV